MVQIIAGDKGKGKTRHLLDRANEAIKDAQGSIVYLDKNTKHMYDLSNRIRLINVSDFPVVGHDGFVGFVSGIISQDHDLELMFFDSFLKIADLEDDSADILPTIKALENLSEKYHVSFVISISVDPGMLPEEIKKDIVVAL